MFVSLLSISTLVSSFTTTFTSIMGFITGNVYTSAVFGTILVLGIAGAVIAFFRR